MDQRGRKSSAKLATVKDTADYLPPVPDGYSDEQAQHWKGIIASKPVGWWDSGSLPILDDYCKSIVEAQRIADLMEASHPLTDDDELKRYDALQKIHGRLAGIKATAATKLRLTPQSRYNAKSADTASRKAGKGRPWSSD